MASAFTHTAHDDTHTNSDLRRRCELLYKAKGGLFEEGGRAPKARRPL